MLLVLLTAGVYLGLVDAIVAYPRTLGGDVVVAEAGSSPTFMRSTSRLPLDAADRVARIPGVARVDPLHGRLIWLERDGRQALVFLVGLYPEETFAVPPTIVEGRGRPLKFRLLHVVEFTGGGDIRREQVWVDMAAIAQQLPQG